MKHVFLRGLCTAIRQFLRSPRRFSWHGLPAREIGHGQDGRATLWLRLCRAVLSVVNLPLLPGHLECRCVQRQYQCPCRVLA